MHLFFPYLCALSPSKKTDLFDTFLEQLHHFDPFILEEPAQFLLEHAQPIGNFELIQDYIKSVQRDPERFGALLQKQLL